MTNKEFCARLRKAKKLAVGIYYQLEWGIYYACDDVGIYFEINATFDKSGTWENRSRSWCFEVAKSKDDIAEVFNASIRNLGEKP